MWTAAGPYSNSEFPKAGDYFIVIFNALIDHILKLQGSSGSLLMKSEEQSIKAKYPEEGKS